MTFSERGTTIVRSLQSVLHALDEHKSALEREEIYAVLVSHVRSAMPMVLGAASTVEPAAETTLVCDDGSEISFSVHDGKLSMYVRDESGSDAVAPLTPTKIMQLLADARRVLAAMEAKR